MYFFKAGYRGLKGKYYDKVSRPRPAVLEAGRYLRGKLPECGELIEFWKDEPKLKCPKCGKLAVNPKLDLGCAEWCRYAKECLGISLSHESNILCNRLIEEMKNIFGKDKLKENT